jgi:hypothetical protein
MALYSIRYVCEGSLTSKKGLSLSFEEREVRFDLSAPGSEGHRLRVTLEVEGTAWQDADINAQKIIQPCLDALSFSTGQPLLLLYWELILKDESGSESRKALCFEASEHPAHFELNETVLGEAQAILNREPEPVIDLCWHRYALHRTLTLDRFVFQWLAFESMAGEAQIERKCEKCGHPFSHAGSNRNEAMRIYRSAEPEATEKEFKREIWGKDRNTVFHGDRYPAPAHLQRLNSVTPKLRRACEMEIERRFELAPQQRRVGTPAVYLHRYNMFGWKTAAPGSQFATDFPWDEVQREFFGRPPGSVWVSVPSERFTTLDFVKDSKGW